MGSGSPDRIRRHRPGSTPAGGTGHASARGFVRRAALAGRAVPVGLLTFAGESEMIRRKLISEEQPGETGTRTVAVVGRWAALDDRPPVCHADRVILRRCGCDRAELHDLFVQLVPAWLVLGSGLDDEAMVELLYTARVCVPAVHLAVLGPDDDPERVDRWLHRGCEVYLAESAPLSRLLRAIDVAGDGLLVVDPLSGAFAPLTTPLVATLTTREDEVLQLVRRGLRNHMIAEHLHISGRTVEYHLRKVFYKLGVHNRVEAVIRAGELGL
jgi:DNA-binding NarL/FixJ family response regulator